MLSRFLLVLLLWGGIVGPNQVLAQFPSAYGGCPTQVPSGPLPSSAELLSTVGMRRALSAIDSSISSLLSTNSLPSVSAAVVYDQTIIWYGIFNASIGTAPTLDTVYRTGSIGKLYTTLLMMVARDEGLLHLDTPVASLIPDFHFVNPFEQSSRGPTFQQLASHMAGIPTSDALHLNEHTITNREMFALLSNLSLTTPPDTIPLYSNLGFACLGNLVAELFNTTYRDALQRFVLSPLQLNSTSVAYDATRFDGRMAEGWDYGQPAPFLDATADWGWYDPCCGPQGESCHLREAQCQRGTTSAGRGIQVRIQQLLVF